MNILSFTERSEENSHQNTQPFNGVRGVGGLGGLYPAVRKYAKCHHNGSTYEHGESVSLSKS